MASTTSWPGDSYCDCPRGPVPVAPAAPATGPACRRLNVNGSRIPPGGPLTVAVNGAVVGTWDDSAYGDLEPFMRPGPNTIAPTFTAAPAGSAADAELRRLPSPGGEQPDGGVAPAAGAGEAEGGDGGGAAFGGKATGRYPGDL